MKKWSDLFNQPIRAEHEDRVFQAVAGELENLQKKNQKSRWAFIAALSTAAAAVAVYLHSAREPGDDELEILALDDEMLDDLEFFDELDALEDWDEKLDG